MEYAASSLKSGFRPIVFGRGLLLLILLVLSSFDAHSAFAGRNGISSDGKDFYIGYMPGIKHPGTTWSGVSETYYVLVGSYNDGNVVSVSYFDSTTGNETQGPQAVIAKGRTWKYRLDVSHMTPQRPGEVAEFCAAHIRSTYPVSVQCYSEGSSAGGLLQAIPTPALGKNYVIASWNDNPLQNNPGYLNRDSSSGEFLVIAAFDNTTFTYVPASTTATGVIGTSSGNGSANNIQHPVTVTLRRGQVFWVRSLSVDASNDISGSTVTSNKPVAVIAGHERALLGDPSGIWHSLDNDVRDIMIEQMTPVEDWESEYSSIPMVPPPAVTRLLVNGTGEMYRVYTADPNGGQVDGWIGGLKSPYTLQLAQFQNPIVAYNNITDPIDLVCHDGKKMYVVMYDYFQGQHDVDPGEKVGKKGSDDPESGGGGPTAQDETTYKMPSEMDIVPLNRWRKNAVWQVPNGSNYRGYQWVNVLTGRDSARTLQMSFNGGAYRPLLGYPFTGPINIPLHPELAGYQFQLPAGDYALISPNSPFVVYSYGRTQTQYKDGWAYAAPCGEAYGSRDSTTPPKMVFTPMCGGWNVTVSDSVGNDEGIADIELLNDPQGVYARPARVSNNVSLNPNPPNYVVGDPVVHFQILVNNPLLNAYAALYVVDRAGNDTVFEYTYTAPSVGITPAFASMKNAIVGQDSCTTVVFHNNKNSGTLLLDSAFFRFNNQGFKLTSTIPSIPATLKPGDSLIADVCFNAKDTGGVHIDSLIFTLDCIHDTIPLFGSAGTPIITATDADFGSVLIGRTVCKNVTVTNIGNAPLDLTTGWVLHNIKNFALDPASAAKLPVWLLPGQKMDLTFCYTPDSVKTDSTTNDWGTNLAGEYLHHNKDYSSLLGRGVKPGVLWDRLTQPYATECDKPDTVRIVLYNNNSAEETIDSVVISGPDANEFVMVNSQVGPIVNNEIKQPFPIGFTGGDSTSWVDVAFVPNDAKGWNPRTAVLTAYNQSKTNPVVNLTAKLTHASDSIGLAAIDFGLVTVGTPITKYDTVFNTGTAPLVIKSVGVDNPAFTISGINVGDSIPPGGYEIETIVGVIATSGEASGIFSVNGFTNCTKAVATTLDMKTNFADATGTDVDFPTVYTCQDDTLWASATNTGSKNVILHEVQILNNATDTNATEFDFVSTLAPAIIPDTVLTPGETIRIPVMFHPSLAQTSKAVLEYTFDTVLNGVTFKIVDKEIIGIGNNITQVTSIAAPSGQPYSVQTGGTFDVPITIANVFPTQAQVYGYKLNISWRRDLFQPLFDMTNINLGYGSIAPGTAITDDGQGNETLNLVVKGNVAMDNTTTLATLHFQLMVAKDLQSTFTISQANFTDINGNLICYISNAKVPGTFVPQDICGDSTIRSFMRTGMIDGQITSITPNPASGDAAIDYEVRTQNVPVTIQVYNMLGDVVQTIFKNEPHEIGAWRATVDASKLTSGVYVIRFETPNSSSTERFVLHK